MIFANSLTPLLVHYTLCIAKVREGSKGVIGITLLGPLPHAK